VLEPKSIRCVGFASSDTLTIQKEIYMNIRGIEIEPGVMNAAYSGAKSPEDIEALARTRIGAIVVGSITPEPRDGNPEPRLFIGDGYALNSFGMPNGGIDYYREELPGMIRTAHDADKKLILSVAGFSLNDYTELARFAGEVQPDILELNLGCPNVGGKPIASFDLEYMSKIIRTAHEHADIPLTVKLSPYSNPATLTEVARLIGDSGLVSGVVTSNSFPNSLMFHEDGSPVLAAENGGGMTGEALRPIALGQVAAFRRALPEEIAVIGAGGIETKAHVDLFRRAGANAVQAATLIVRDGHAAIDRLV
jgi:dihydroorotate dehydrogenase (fumarate)